MKPQSIRETFYTLFSIAVRLSLAAIFMVAGSLKLFQNERFEESLQQFPFLSANLHPIIAGLLPSIEIIVGIFLAIGLWTRYSAIFAACLFVSFSAIYVPLVLSPGIEAYCNCFGSSFETKVDLVFFLRNILFIGLAIYISSSDYIPFSADSYINQRK